MTRSWQSAAHPLQRRLRPFSIGYAELAFLDFQFYENNINRPKGHKLNVHEG
jgi:hypothetical protein